MRVCMVTTCFPTFKGDFAANFILEPARALVRQGVEVAVVAPHCAGAARRELLEGIDVHRFAYAWPPSLQRLAYGDGIPDNLRNSRLARLEVPGLFAAMAAKVVHVARGADVIHAFWTPCAVAAAPAAKLWSLPVLTRVFGDGIRLGARWMNRIALAASDGVVCCEGELLEYLQTYDYHRPVFDIKHLPDFRRLEGTGPLESELADWCAAGDAVVTFVGRLIGDKDPLGFVRSVPMVRRAHPRARFLIVGNGPLRGEVEALIAELGVGECLRLTGSRNDVAAVLGASTVFVAYSPLSNCFSTTILEAMTLGVPAVVTDVGDPTGAFRAKDYVELVRPRDPANLAAGIINLLASPALRDHRVQMGRQFLQDHGFTPEAVGRQTVRAYEMLCPRRSRPAVGRAGQ